MKCREAKEKLIRLADGRLDAAEQEALREHVSGCPDCARWELVEQRLTSDIEQIRTVHVPHTMTVSRIREGIAARERNRKTTKPGIRIMRQVRDTYFRRPRLSLATAALSVLLVASALVPLRTEHPPGYEVAFAAPAGGLMLNRGNAERLLEVLEITDAGILLRETDSGVEYRIAPLEDSAKVRKLTVLLESLGGQRVRSTPTRARSRGRTIWQLLFDGTREKAGSKTLAEHREEQGGSPTLHLDDEFEEDFALWIPVGDQADDTLRGLLLDRRGVRTNIQIVGESGGMDPDDCGWHQYLNNSVMNTQTPDGKEATFNLYDLEDVRKLEKMGYNFATMTWDAPGQVPVPGMGPGLSEIKLDPQAGGATIEFMVPQAYEVELLILDHDGHAIRSLLNCIPLAGIHQVAWDGLDADGRPVPTGTYICRFTAGEFTETREVRLAR